MQRTSTRTRRTKTTTTKGKKAAASVLMPVDAMEMEIRSVTRGRNRYQQTPEQEQHEDQILDRVNSCCHNQHYYCHMHAADQPLISKCIECMTNPMSRSSCSLIEHNNNRTTDQVIPVSFPGSDEGEGDDGDEVSFNPFNRCLNLHHHNSSSQCHGSHSGKLTPHSCMQHHKSFISLPHHHHKNSAVHLISTNILMSLLMMTVMMAAVADAAGKDHRIMTQDPNSPTRVIISPANTECLKNRMWWAFLLSSLGTFVIGVFIILIFRALAFIFRSMRGTSGTASSSAAAHAHSNSVAAANSPYSVIDKHNSSTLPPGHRPPGMMANKMNMNDPYAMAIGPDGQPIKDTSWASEAKDWAGELISGQSATGRILVVLVFLLSIASLVIYFIDASRIGPHGDAVEKCAKWSDSPTQQMDLGLNVFFAIYFFIRFVAAADKLWFMLELYSFVDYFTIPPSFVSLYLDRTWIGLRFLRALRLMSFPDILQYLNVLKTSSSIRLAQLISIVISVWLAAAGIIHLVKSHHIHLSVHL
jgi:potassium large conductance calcium-activated channel subfamily M alpha protein 1